MVPTSMIVEMAGAARMATDSHHCAFTDNCSADQECAGEIEDIPVCNDPSATFPLEGTAVASPYKNVESVFSSLMGELAEITGAASGSIQISMAEKTTTGTASSSSETGTVSNSDETGTSSSSAEASNTSASAETGAAAALGGPGSFGQTVTMVMCVWGVAALGGAGWLLM